MKCPYIDCLFVHDAMVEDNKAYFGECEGRHIDDGGGENNLCNSSVGARKSGRVSRYLLIDIKHLRSHIP
jgi:hypothetical protein